MGRKTPPFWAYEEWTTARFWSFIRSALRAAWNKYPVKYLALKQARRSCKKGNQKWEYQCAHCKKWFKQTEVQVDHITEVGTLRDYGDLPGFVKRLFCSVNELQILCKEDHKNKKV